MSRLLRRFQILRVLSALIIYCSTSLYGQNVEGVSAVVGKEVPLERLTVLVSNGKPSAMTLTAPATATIHRYANDASTPEAVSASYDPVRSVWSIAHPEPGYGYFASVSGELPRYYYLLDYTDYRLGISHLVASRLEADPCSRVLLSWQGTIHPMHFYTPSGIRQTLPREMSVTLTDAIYNAEQKAYEEAPRTQTIEPLEQMAEVNAPLIDTRFRILGDRWTKVFALDFTPIESDTYTTARLEQHAEITAHGQNGTELKDVSWESLSAPTTLRLVAHANEPSAALLTWKIAQYAADGTTLIPVLNYSGAETEYTLRSAGRFRIWLELTSRDGGCHDSSFSQEVRVTESHLDVPNAFTPGSSSGVNDVFRVAARSLVRFEGRIFSRSGQELYRWTDPAGGWDGTYQGKLVPTGAYLYTITAEGADDVSYQRSGTVSILRSEYETPTGY